MSNRKYKPSRWFRAQQRLGRVLRRYRRRLLGDRQQPADAPATDKAREELGYWRKRLAKEGRLTHHHYRFYYTDHFGLEPSFYRAKRILDIGCGPRGSLQWAKMTKLAVGVDPLSARYVELGIHRQRMRYVAAVGEHMPFATGAFEVVCSFNSLDHVDDIDHVVEEIVRVIAPGGTFLLLTELNHAPTASEPQTFSWDVIDKFVPGLEIVTQDRYEPAEGIYQSLERHIPYNYDDTTVRKGVLSAMLRKSARSPTE